jgi:RNA polymerase sigma-70 factor, ECF subfamily
VQRTDAELVEAACQGELAAFGQLYERHFRMAAGIARSRLSDRHLAEDAAQEAFAIACRKLASLKDGSRFPQWLGAICRRAAIRAAKSRPRHLSLDPQCNDKGVSIAAAGEAAAESEVRKAIDQLDAKTREIVLLHYYSELSYEEISRVLEISPQAIHGRLQRARRKLASELDRDRSQGANP